MNINRVMNEESYGYEEYELNSELSVDESYSIYQNSYSLPLGYNIAGDVADTIEYTNNPYTYQERFISALLGNDVSLYSSIEGNCQSQDGDEIETWVFTVNSDGPVYLYVDGSDAHGNFYADNCSLYVNGKYKQDICKRFLINSVYLGEYKGGDEICVEIQHNNNDRTSHILYMAQLDTEVFTQCISQLGTNSDSHLSMDGNIIKGTYSTQEDTTMFLSIPYEEGWTAYVDGEKVEVKKVLDTFMGI